MTIYSIILSSLSLAFIICNIIIGKKIPLLTFFLMIFNIVFILIKLVDPTYYDELMSEGLTADDLDKILFTYSFILFVFCITSFMVKLLTRIRKVNSRLDNTAIISNLKVLSLDNSSYKQLVDEFNLSNTPMLLKSKFIKLNKSLQEILEIDKCEITEQELDSFIVGSDIDSYNNGSYFRINYGSFVDWFEKRSYSYRGELISVIKRIDNKSYSSITVGGFNELSRHLANLDNSIHDYGLILIRLTHILEDNSDKKAFIEVDNNSMRIVLACKYLISIRDFFKNQTLDVYKLDNDEFAFLLQNNASLTFLKEKLKENSNALNNFCYFVGETKYIITTKTVLCNEFVKSEVDSDILSTVTKEMNRIIDSKINASIISENKNIESNININIKKDLKE